MAYFECSGAASDEPTYHIVNLGNVTGASQTINIKSSYPDLYADLRTSNFVVGAAASKTVSTIGSISNMSVTGQAASISASSRSYEPETGVLTVTTGVLSEWNNRSLYSGSGYVTSPVYMIY